MSIRLNPTNDMIDIDLNKAEGIMIFHNTKSEKEFREIMI